LGRYRGDGCQATQGVALGWENAGPLARDGSWENIVRITRYLIGLVILVGSIYLSFVLIMSFWKGQIPETIALLVGAIIGVILGSRWWRSV
jgi:hypothetical protein